MNVWWYALIGCGAGIIAYLVAIAAEAWSEARR